MMQFNFIKFNQGLNKKLNNLLCDIKDIHYTEKAIKLDLLFHDYEPTLSLVIYNIDEFIDLHIVNEEEVEELKFLRSILRHFYAAVAEHCVSYKDTEYFLTDLLKVRDCLSDYSYRLKILLEDWWKIKGSALQEIK